MGACDFFTKAEGNDAKEAFMNAREEAAWESGHGGYTGTIAEKRDFVMVSVPEGKSPMDYVNRMMDNNDPRINDKWGPAGCVKLQEGKYLFFGWASS